MTVTVARDTIVCPKCGNQRIVSMRQRRRTVVEGGGLCTTCRGVGQTRPFQDDDLRFWLRRYGAEVPAGEDVSRFIAAGGCPPELAELAHDAFPD
jgi:hypothetical protein